MKKKQNDTPPDTQLADTIVQLQKELDALTYSVSHDLRAPLRAISGYTQILKEDYDQLLDSEGRRVLTVIGYNAEKMSNLLDNVLTLSRIGRKELRPTEIDLRELVEGAVIDVEKVRAHNASIHLGELHALAADYGLMNQVLVQLIDNAIKFSSKQEKPEISISSALSGKNVILSVADKGVGFDMKYADKLFSLFQRLHSPEEFEGTGVGLAIVQRIVSRHGGKVWAEATPNGGATFYVSLPKK